MITLQQSVIGSRERTTIYSRKLLNEFIGFNIGGWGSVGLLGLGLLSYTENISPELTVALGLGAVVFHTFFLIELSRFVNTCREALKERAKLSSLSIKGGSIQAIIAPLGERLLPDQKKALTDSQSGMTPPLLVSGQPDLKEMVLATVPDDESSLSTVTKERKVALDFITRSLLDQKVIGANPLSCVERTRILDGLTDILAPKPTSAGLTLTVPELDFLNAVLVVGAVTEKAPEPKSAYLRKFARLIESYILHKRITLVGQDAVNILMSQAIQAERLAGCSVSPPIGLWRETQQLKRDEEGRVIFNEEQLIAMAKSVTALANSRIPEVRRTFFEVFPDVITILKGERDRLERLKDRDEHSLAAINTVLFILGISIDKLVDKKTINNLSQLFGNRLLSKTRITPRDLLDEFENSGFGSCSIEGDRIIVTARNISLVDPLACAAAICYPHVPRIEIDIGEENKDNIVEQSAMIPTAVFYSQRLLLKDRQFISRLLREQSPPVVVEFPSPTPALLTNISVQPAS